MSWMLSPVGIAVIAVLIIAIASLIYWKRKPIQSWLSRQKVEEVEIGAGPVKVKLKDKGKAKSPPSSAGVSFGEGADLSGAKIRRMAGRDIRHGAGAVQSPEGQAPGVDFGKDAKLRNAEIEDVAGRDVVEG